MPLVRSFVRCDQIVYHTIYLDLVLYIHFVLAYVEPIRSFIRSFIA